MILTSKQQQGLDIAIERYKSHKNYTCIAGYAGTGKSTLVSYIVANLQLTEEQVAYIAYTGKAALELRHKGCSSAQTAHRLLYKSFLKKDGTYGHIPLDYIGDYKLIVVDEISMLPNEMWKLLLSHHIHVIALGDPGQLPPIGEDNGILSHPHIFLDEIMRQEEDNEIIKLTMDIRAGKPLTKYNGKEVMIIDKEDLESGMLMWADQIICAKNSTRHWINHLMRQYIYGDDVSNEPRRGDKIICTHNNWNIMTEHGDALVNGTLGYVEKTISFNTSIEEMPKLLSLDFRPDIYTAEEQNESIFDLSFRSIKTDYKLLTTGEHSINKQNFKKIPPFMKPEEIEYGYGITCWKAQGSEYDNVLVFEEDYPALGSDLHRRYLYTAATRARKKLIIVRA